MLNYIRIEIMAHRKRNDDGYIIPKSGASQRTIKRWDSRHEYNQPKDTGFKKLDKILDTTNDMAVSGTFKPMKKVDL